MWWCCGRRNKDDPGCKYAKHQITEQEEEEGVLGGGTNDGVEYDEDGNVKSKLTRQKTDNIRCYVSSFLIMSMYIVLQKVGSFR